MKQNYSNPFNLATNIKFQISGSNHIILKVYTVHGQGVATLVNEELRPGSYEVTWDAGSSPSGVYFYRLEVGSSAEIRKLMLLR